MNDHQAQGLTRLFSRDKQPVVVSVFAPAATNVFDDFPADLARIASQHCWRVLQVNAQPTLLDFRPLFQWQATKPLKLQTAEIDNGLMLFAPGCKSGEAEIVRAAADAGLGLDMVLFGGLCYSLEGAEMEACTAQALILLVNEANADACFAFVKCVTGLSVAMDMLLAGEGSDRVAQAVQRFLKLPVSLADNVGRVWHIRHAVAQTSSNTLSECPDLPRYVARILNRRGTEAKSITSHASK